MSNYKTFVDDRELLAFYVTDKQKEVQFSNNQVKGDFFLPRPNYHRNNFLETSCVRYGNRSTNDMQNAGQSWARRYKKNFVGHVSLQAMIIRNVKPLDVNHTYRNWEKLHSDVINWNEDEVYQRVQAEEIAQQKRYIDFHDA